MDNNEQDAKHVNNDQVQPLFDDKTSDNQDQNVDTSTKNNAFTPGEASSLANTNIESVQNTAQVTNASNEAQKPEVTTNDPVENDKKSVNNEHKQSQLDTNIGENQNKEDSINANKDDQDKRAATQLDKDKVVETELDRLLSRIDKGKPPEKIRRRPS